MMKLKVLKRNKDAKLPEKAYGNSAGWDLSYVGPDMLIHPGESKLFNTGLSFFIPDDYCILVRNRSGVASKKALLVGAELIDANYAGEAFVNLVNTSTVTREIKKGDKIAQFLILPVPKFEAEEIDQEEFDKLHANSQRGANALGSSG